MKVSTRRGRALITNGALAVLLLGGAVFANTRLGADRAAGEVVPRTVAAARGTVTASVSASGAVESARTRALSFGTTGTVEQVHVKAGDEVRKGAILATLDDAAARENLSAAGATYRSAVEDGTSTARLYAAYVKARNAYREAQRTLDGTVLRAPFGGTVTAVNGSVGGSSGGSSGGQAQTSGGQQSGQAGASGFVELADTARLRLVGGFTEADAGRLKLGQAATVTFDALPGVTAAGKVSQIEPVAATSDNVVTYPVTISLAEVPEQVRLGQTATVQVVVGRAENVVTVPSAAISTSGGQSTVTLLIDGRQVETPVRIGVRSASLTEITSGVSEGDLLVPPTPTGTTTGGDQRQGGLGGGLGRQFGGAPGGGR
ncbi:macrolide-specific efflux system membrane fusion protein [Nonomuraea muscovyensis]|uniref:Macrolide-specific efflux system membrane fusion protein n=1 Tax=Nonomuraea muscovyensis TaxID=1124761 RepID=A0A7X0EWF8_9ACTN|nr:HlyD family efflux transporter periplasmic adaptor subunit [Nonomuraea muscovyensis]MBB6343581.1 macrolide-specific efflux system membrane fusion protein [Nonomuraea muscovyensis]